MSPGTGECLRGPGDPCVILGTGECLCGPGDPCVTPGTGECLCDPWGAGGILMC